MTLTYISYWNSSNFLEFRYNSPMEHQFQRINTEVVSSMPIEITTLVEGDIVNLEPILRQHVRDSQTGEKIEEEISSIQDYMMGEKDEHGRIRKYLVAKSDGQILGCMAYSEMDPDMVEHFDDLDPKETSELLNAFTDSKVFRGGGVGRRLLEAVYSQARSEGKTNLVIHSGPRYQKSWGFYDKLTDETRGFIQNKYGEGRHAKTWLKRL